MFNPDFFVDEAEISKIFLSTHLKNSGFNYTIF